MTLEQTFEAVTGNPGDAAPAPEGASPAPEEGQEGAAVEKDAQTQDEGQQDEGQQEEGHVEEGEGDQGDEILPFGEHPRWKKMLDSNREQKVKLQEFEARSEELQGLEGARDLDKWLKEDPKNAQAVMDMMNGKQSEGQEEAKEENYEDFESVPSTKFKEVDQLKKQLADLESKLDARDTREHEAHLETVEDRYDDLLKAEGLIDKEGNEVSEEMLKVAKNLTLASLNQIARDPNRPTEAELVKAFSIYQGFTKSAEKQALAKAVSSKPPPSGSRAGSSPPEKVKDLTEDERMKGVEAEFAKWNGSI